MKTPNITPLLAAGFAIAGSAALAQAVPFDKVDANDDGALSQPELVAVFGEENAMLLLEQDTNGDDALSEAEIVAARQPGRADEMAEDPAGRASGKAPAMNDAMTGDMDAMMMGEPG